MKQILSSLMLIVSSGTTLTATQKPNVIFVYADDLGKGLLSSYGQQHYTTPNIDRLISQGTSFTNAYGCMLSAPARASLLTGYHDCHIDKWSITNGGLFVGKQTIEDINQIENKLTPNDVRLPENDLYLAQIFKKAGYTTGEIGKLEWGFTATRKQMKEHGWDYYFGYLDHVRCHGFYPPFLFENDKMVFIEGNTHNNCGKSIEQETTETHKERWNMEGKKVYSQSLFEEKIKTFISNNKERPFFLFHPTQLPHGPVAIPAIHPEVANNPLLSPIEKEYASMVKLLDDQVGMIIEEVKKQGLEKNTIIIFSSDNGHEIYYSQKGRIEKPYRNMDTQTLFDDYKDKYYTTTSHDPFNGNAGLAGLKRSNLEGGVRVPLVFYGKGIIPKGKVRNDIVSNYDFLTTMANWLNIELESTKDGVSYKQLLLKNKSLQKDRYIVYSSNYGPAIIRNDGFKLRYYKQFDIFELYNIRKDPQERNNIIVQFPQEAENLKSILLKECKGEIRNGINKYG